jgi:hypothetical protein
MEKWQQREELLPEFLYLSTKLHAIASDKAKILIKQITNYQSFRLDMKTSTN